MQTFCRPCVLVPESILSFVFQVRCLRNLITVLVYRKTDYSNLSWHLYFLVVDSFDVFFFLCVLNGLVHFLGNTPLTYTAWWYHLMVAYLTAMSIYVSLSDFIAFFFVLFL